MESSMTFRGYRWRRKTHEKAMRLWKAGWKCDAYLLFREVIKDGRAEAATTNTKD
jgi:hypothetical protein